MKQEKIIKKYIADIFITKKEGNTITYNVSIDSIVDICKQLYFGHKLQLKTITASDERKDGGGFKIYYVFGVPYENIYLIPYVILKDKEEFPSLTKDIHEASGYERKIKSFLGLTPTGHPHPQQILLHENWPDTVFPLRKDFDWQKRPTEGRGKYKFQKVEGEGIYEIPVGPVHAGIIEPGHFRFTVAGEEIILLESKLGYTHKGTEKLFEVLPMADKIRLSERVSGDTSFSHSLAFCQAIENLSDIEVPARAKYLRVIFSEMERLANHFNDIGFIMMDTGYSFGGANCARLREVIMQWNERLTGSRFLRGVNTIGGLTRDIEDETSTELLPALKKLQNDFNEVIEIAKSSSSLLNRLSGTGKLACQIAVDHGVIGVVGKAMEIAHDARIEYPYAAYDQLKFSIALEKEGDVMARWSVRIKEVQSSIEILEQAILGIPADKKLKSDKDVILRSNSCTMGVAEGWRGEIIYFVVTDSAGHVGRVDVRDPSFVNWPLVSYATKGNVVPDFPLINKSFNLSYSGNDL